MLTVTRTRVVLRLGTGARACVGEVSMRRSFVSAVALLLIVAGCSGLPAAPAPPAPAAPAPAPAAQASPAAKPAASPAAAAPGASPAAAGPAAAKPGGPLTKVRIAVPAGISDRVWLNVGNKQGYFTEQGLEVEVIDS